MRGELKREKDPIDQLCIPRMMKKIHKFLRTYKRKTWSDYILEEIQERDKRITELEGAIKSIGWIAHKHRTDPRFAPINKLVDDAKVFNPMREKGQK